MFVGLLEVGPTKNLGCSFAGRPRALTARGFFAVRPQGQAVASLCGGHRQSKRASDAQLTRYRKITAHPVSHIETDRMALGPRSASRHFEIYRESGDEEDDTACCGTVLCRRRADIA